MNGFIRTSAHRAAAPRHSSCFVFIPSHSSAFYVAIVSAVMVMALYSRHVSHNTSSANLSPLLVRLCGPMDRLDPRYGGGLRDEHVQRGAP